MAQPQYHQLLQFGDNPYSHYYVDLENHRAFTLDVQQIQNEPNLIVRLTRDPDWKERNPNVMGPDNSYYYFGPNMAMGTVVYGNNRMPINMYYFRLQKREGSTSRYFKSQSGKDYKWRLSSHRMELFDGRTSLAIWEVSPPAEPFFARLTIKHSAMQIVTEIVTTAVLNRMAFELGW